MKKGNKNVALRFATISNRGKAFIIDDILLTLLSLIILWQPIQSANGDIMAIISILNQSFMQIIFLKIFYHTFFIWYYGATLGKMYANIKVVNEFGNRIGFVRAFVRASMRVISENLLYMGFVLAYFMPFRQTLHDKIARTVVVDV